MTQTVRVQPYTIDGAPPVMEPPKPPHYTAANFSTLPPAHAEAAAKAFNETVEDLWPTALKIAEEVLAGEDPPGLPMVVCGDPFGP